jgi:hypothetical protein
MLLLEAALMPHSRFFSFTAANISELCKSDIISRIEDLSNDVVHQRQIDKLGVVEKGTFVMDLLRDAFDMIITTDILTLNAVSSGALVAEPDLARLAGLSYWWRSCKQKLVTSGSKNYKQDSGRQRLAPVFEWALSNYRVELMSEDPSRVAHEFWCLLDLLLQDASCWRNMVGPDANNVMTTLNVKQFEWADSDGHPELEEGDTNEFKHTMWKKPRPFDYVTLQQWIALTHQFCTHGSKFITAINTSPLTQQTHPSSVDNPSIDPACHAAMTVLINATLKNADRLLDVFNDNKELKHIMPKISKTMVFCRRLPFKDAYADEDDDDMAVLTPDSSVQSADDVAMEPPSLPKVRVFFLFIPSI